MVKRLEREILKQEGARRNGEEGKVIKSRGHPRRKVREKESGKLRQELIHKFLEPGPGPKTTPVRCTRAPIRAWSAQGLSSKTQARRAGTKRLRKEDKTGG